MRFCDPILEFNMSMLLQSLTSCCTPIICQHVYMTLSVGNNTNPLSLFLCWRQHFWTTRECLQRIPHRNSHLSCSSSNMSNHIISTTYIKSHVKDKKSSVTVSVSKTTKELQLQWKMDVNPVQLSPEVKMPQFIVSRVKFTL